MASKRTGKPNGRPSSYNEQIALTIYQRIADGHSLRQICSEESMPSKATIFKWLIDFPEFSDQYAQARALQMETMADDLLELADSADEKNYNPKRLQVDTRKWLMSKLAPKKYGDNAQFNVTGEITLGIGELLTTARQRMLAAKSEPITLDGQLDGQNDE